MINLPPNARLLLAIVLAAYLVGLLILSVVATFRVKSEEDYLVAGRRLPLWLAWGTLMATWFGAATMMGAAEAARQDGLLGVTLDPFASGATLILAGLFFARPLWRMKLYTVSDFFARKYGNRSEIFGSIVQAAGYFGWIAAQFVALADIGHSYFGIDARYGILIAAGISLCYTMSGGMWSVTLTDTAQILIALAGLIILADATFSQLGGGSLLGGINRMLADTAAERPEHLWLVPAAGGAAAWLLWTGDWATGLFGNIPGQDLQQRVFAARDEKTASRACLLAGGLYIAFGLIPVGLGMASNISDPGEPGSRILPLLAGKYLSPLMAVVFVVSLVSIIMSTATSAVLAPAAIIAHNLLGRFRWAEGRRLLLDRGSVLLVTSGGVALAYTGERIMDLLDVSLSIALGGLVVPLVVGLYGKPRGEFAILCSMLAGMSVWLARILFEKVLVPSSAAEAAGLEYVDYVANQFPAEGVGDVGHWLATGYATVPADLQSLAAAAAGYLAGQWWLARQIAKSIVTKA